MLVHLFHPYLLASKHLADVHLAGLENRAPFQMYNRVNMITPTDGIGIFRYEFDSSQKDASNGPGQQWQRNFVA